MAFQTTDRLDRYMSPVKLKVNAIRWIVVLVGSVSLLVILLLRRSDPTAGNNFNHELEDKLNRIASQSRWSIPRSQEWYSKQPWILGANYVPSTAVNVLEMWQEDTFDVKTIQRELEWANRRLGMNALRVFIHFLVWKENRDGFFRRLDKFLDIAANNSLKVMLVLFDECWNPEPLLGKQPDPVPGVHNSQWVRCPGQMIVHNESSWPLLSQYTRDVIEHYKTDQRIFAWDLYNEPECSKQVNIILPLLRYIYSSARSVRDVEQPMTIGIATWPLTSPLATFELSASDIISFHSYGALTNVISNITDFQKVQSGRPILCTEWLARTFGSTVFTHLSYFQSEKIGAIQWGLVAGRTQTYYPWKSPKDAPMPRLWFHDIFYSNGTAFNRFEEDFYLELTRNSDSRKTL